MEAARFDNGSFVVLPSLEIPKANKDGVVTAANVDTRQSPASAATDSLDSGNPVWISIMYGIINATIVLPVLMSFGSIIYRDQAFEAYMPMLVKLTVVSGVVHQVCFSTFSTLPFAVGQVQDAGLIFLSQMASRMVQHCQSREYDDDTLLATVTVGLSLCTAILGCGLVLMGHFRLAQYVQMLPTRYVVRSDGSKSCDGVSVNRIASNGLVINDIDTHTTHTHKKSLTIAIFSLLSTFFQ